MTNSRKRARNPSVWRRRTCEACVAQFSTIEMPDYETSLTVHGPTHDSLRPFNRDKLFLSLYKSLGHRRNALRSATELTDTIIGRVLKSIQANKSVIPLDLLAKTSYQTLKRYDPLSAHTYKAYHQSLLKAKTE